MKKLIFAAITLLVGLTVLAGFFFGDQLGPTLTLIFDWGLVLVAVGGLIGMVTWPPSTFAISSSARRAGFTVLFYWLPSCFHWWPVLCYPLKVLFIGT